MPERYVFCGGLRAGRNRPNALHIDVNAPAGSPNRVNLEIEDLSKRLADNIPDVLTDMLEIAAYVYCADQFTTRGTSQMSEMGAEWRRQFRFKIPVRCLEVWSKPDVREALTETLGFLSEDEFEFEFVQGANSLPLQSYLPLNDPTAQAISPDEVVLFSGGLDSLCAQDPADNYVVDLFAGEHQPGPALTMMESYVLRAQKLATMSQQTFVSTYGQIFRAIPHLPGSADENVKRIWELHRQHGQEVIGVVDNELKSRATVAAMAELPPTSLLSMVVSPIAKQPAYTDPVEAEPTAAVQAAADKHDYTWKRIPFAIDAKMRTVVFERGLEMGGGVFGLIASLAQDFEEDLDAGTFHDQYRFVKARTLARRLNIDEQSLRQRVSRSRKKIEEAFLKTFDRQLDAADVIQNQEWKGYRLNPYLLLVKPAQLRQGTAPTSQVGAQDVTSPGAPH